MSSLTSFFAESLKTAHTSPIWCNKKSNPCFDMWLELELIFFKLFHQHIWRIIQYQLRQYCLTSRCGTKLPSSIDKIIFTLFLPRTSEAQVSFQTQRKASMCSFLWKTRSQLSDLEKFCPSKKWKAKEVRKNVRRVSLCETSPKGIFSFVFALENKNTSNFCCCMSCQSCLELKREVNPNFFKILWKYFLPKFY